MHGNITLSNTAMICQRRHHRTAMTLMLVYATASAYSGRSIQGRLGRPLSFGLRPSTSMLANNVVASQSQPTSEHRDNSREDFSNYSYVGKYLCNLNVSFMIIASAIMLSPSPSVASTQQTHPSLVLERGGSWLSSSVVATEELSSITPSFIAELGLKPPTEEKPQITLNGRNKDGQPSQLTTSRKSNERSPILRGLVYFPERAPTDPAAKMPSGPQVKQQLDYYSDILVLTAVSAAQPDGPILAGAKFPVSSVRFPFSFQMYKENLLTTKPGIQDAWDGVASTGDIILRANICPSDSSTFPCDVKETKKYAEGVAKLITNLPGLGEGQSVRAPASLALQ